MIESPTLLPIARRGRSVDWCARSVPLPATLSRADAAIAFARSVAVMRALYSAVARTWDAPLQCSLFRVRG